MTDPFKLQVRLGQAEFNAEGQEGTVKEQFAKFVVDLGTACHQYLDEKMVDLTSQRLQCDEIWSFCYAKSKNVPDHMRGKPGGGSVWTWTAIDADTKLVP